MFKVTKLSILSVILKVVNITVTLNGIKSKVFDIKSPFSQQP